MAVQKPTYNDNVGLPDIHYNPLQNYRNVTYNTRLTMMPPKDATESRYNRSYDYKKGIVMWETGGSGSVFLEEINFQFAGTGNGTGNYLTQLPAKISGKFVEPLGGRFIEANSLAALRLGYKNNYATYLLEVSFTGYDETDLAVTCRDWQDKEMIFRWYVTITELKMKLDFKGSTYDFEIMPSDGAALTTDFTAMEDGFKMKGGSKTVGAFCNELATALNTRQDEQVKSGIRCIPNKYVITAHNDIKNLALEYEFFSKNNALWPFKNELQASAGISIQSFIASNVPNSKSMLEHLHRIPTKKDFNSPDSKPGTNGTPIRSLAIIAGARDIAKDKVQAFDPKVGAVAKEVHYFITTKEDGRNIISPQEYADAQDPKQRDARVQNWIKKGLLRKVYKWIYTGENTEVINCDIKIDNMWRSVRPLWISQDGKPIAATATQPTTDSRSPAKVNSKAVSCNDARAMVNVKKPDEIFYAEDMPFSDGKSIAPVPEWYPHMPQFYHMNTTVSQAGNQAALKPESAQEYSIYRQVAAGLAGQADMFSLELEVVGDPYWLLQIPGGTSDSIAPWTDDVWEYEKEQLTEEKMAEKRKHASTATWLSYIYFEAQTPSADIDATDKMALRNSDAISGVYIVTEITNKFSKGRFTTHLKCVREALSNPWNGKSSSAAAASTSNNAAATSPATAGTASAKSNK
jgi:hypothetical protein